VSYFPLFTRQMTVFQSVRKFNSLTSEKITSQSPTSWSVMVLLIFGCKCFERHHLFWGEAENMIGNLRERKKKKVLPVLKLTATLCLSTRVLKQIITKNFVINRFD
jgi:hypothetical protein